MQQKWDPAYRRLVNRFRPEPLVDSEAELKQWFHSRIGSYLLAKQRELVAELPKLPGYSLMELGVSPEVSLLDQFDHLHRFAISPMLPGEPQRSSVGAVADFESLPLPSDTLDTVLVHHCAGVLPEAP